MKTTIEQFKSVSNLRDLFFEHKLFVDSFQEPNSIEYFDEGDIIACRETDDGGESLLVVIQLTSKVNLESMILIGNHTTVNSTYKISRRHLKSKAWMKLIPKESEIQKIKPEFIYTNIEIPVHEKSIEIFNHALNAINKEFRDDDKIHLYEVMGSCITGTVLRIKFLPHSVDRVFELGKKFMAMLIIAEALDLKEKPL